MPVNKCPYYEKCPTIRTTRLFKAKGTNPDPIINELCCDDYGACPTYQHLQQNVERNRKVRGFFKDLSKSLNSS